jgi:hypothetical protein
MGFRIFSGAVLAVIVFIAARSAGVQGGGSFAMAMVPLVSAAINVMTTPVFTVSALAGILFIIVPLLPLSSWLGEDLTAALRGVGQEFRSEVVQPVSAQQSPSAALARRLSDVEAACNSGVLTPQACEEAKRTAIQNISETLGVGGAAPPRPAN